MIAVVGVFSKPLVHARPEVRWLCGELKFALVCVDLGEDVVEVVSGEGRFERSGDLPVVVAEAEQPLAERVERVEVVGCQRLALDDREVQLDLVEPGGVDRQVDQAGVDNGSSHAGNASIERIEGSRRRRADRTALCPSCPRRGRRGWRGGHPSRPGRPGCRCAGSRTRSEPPVPERAAAARACGRAPGERPKICVCG